MLVAAVLGACGTSNENPYGLSEFTSTSGSGGSPAAPGGPSPDPSVTGSPVPSGPPVHLEQAPGGAVTYRPADTFGQGAWVERGTIAATTAARQNVVDAAFAFMSERVQLSNTWQVDEPALRSVATGQALSNMRERAEAQRLAERRSVGRFVLNVASVRVSGDDARLSGCSFDGTIEVSTLGSVLSDAPGGVELTMNLQRNDDHWRVTTFPADKTYCEVPSR